MKENPLSLKHLLKLLKIKIFKHMAVVSKNVYFDVDSYNNTFHIIIGMKSIYVKSDKW